jgi:hypothetical protein
LVGVKRATRGILAVAAALACALAAGAGAAQASLSVPTGGPATTYTGAGTAGVTSAVGAFERAAGGGDNGQASGEQGSGYRHVTWDAAPVSVESGNPLLITSRVRATGSRDLEPWGVELTPPIAVANDGFTSVNSNAGGLFPAYSSPDIWAPYNSDTAELRVIAPASASATPAPAQSRGLGVVFLNVRLASTTQIRYYNGDILLGQVFAPVNAGGASFAALLFPDAVVNRVVITLGSAAIFSYDGHSPTSGGPDSGANNLVAADDVYMGEPAPARPAVAATVGAAVSSVLDTFTETDPAATSFAATIDWGDGTTTPGVISPGAGVTFNVTGPHAYAKLGTYTATVTVTDFSGVEQTSQTEIDVVAAPSATAISCSPAAVAVSAATTCSVSVYDRGAGSTPTGLVTFTTPTPGAVFPGGASCTLGATTSAGTAICFVQFSPGQLVPPQARLTASYGGDLAHGPSDATSTVAVERQRCTLKVLSRRLRPRGIGVLVTCDAHTTVQITGQARATRARGFRAFSLRFGSVRAQVSAGRPTVLVVQAGPGVLPALRTALHRHQRVSLKLTLAAASRGVHTTTTTRVAALRLP